MKGKKLLSVVFSMLFAVSLAACGSGGNQSKAPNNKKNSVKENVKEVKNGEKENKELKVKDGGTIVFSTGSDPLVLNPLYQQDRATYTINNAIFDPLFVVDGNETRYYLAESLNVSEDGLTYTVKLKDNIKWHDGEKITADDIVFSVEAALDEKNNIQYRNSFMVKDKKVEVKKVDDLTVEFKLPDVYPSFKANLSEFNPIPKHVFEGESDLAKSEKNEQPIGSGPYKFKEWKKGEMIILERYNDFYEGKPHIEEVVYRTAADKNTASAALENGEINAMYVSEEKFNKYAQDERFDTYKYDEGMLGYIIYNTKNENLKKKEVRQAISYALNKEDILKASFESLDNTQPAYSILTPNALCYTEDVEKYEYNMEKAKELMKKAGVENFKLKFDYVSSKEEDKNIVLMVQQQLKEIGIEVEPVAIEREVYINKLIGKQERDFDLMLNGYVMGIDPATYADIYKTGAPFNAGSYENTDVDKLWDKAACEKDDAKREELYKTIQQKIAEDAPIYPIQYRKSLIAVDGNIEGVEEAKTVPIYMIEDLSKLYYVEK